LDSNPPDGSTVTISQHNGFEMITIPQSSGGVMRYFIGIFLLFWLGGWFMGFTSALDQILNGEANTFIIFWLGGWTIGGLFAAFFAYRLFKSPIPEKLLLNVPNLSYDSGIPPMQFNFHPANQKDYWKSLFAKQKKHEFLPSHLQTLALRDVDSGNRLTVDMGAQRIEISKGASEIEKEWLYGYLQQKYA